MSTTRQSEAGGRAIELTAEEVETARAHTPGCARVIHFNNAGAALMPTPVLDTVIGHLRLEADIGGYEAARQVAGSVEEVYDSAASLLGCGPDELAFVENATRAWDMAFYSIPFRRGDRILTSMAEYASNFIAYLQVTERFDVRIEVIPNDEHGQICVEGLRDAIDDDVRLVSLTHVPTNGGLVNPAAEVGRIASQAGALYLFDACQSVGQMPIDVADIRCDMLATTGRKYLRGPRGTGLLYVRRDLIEKLTPPLLDLHAARWVEPERYEIRSDARRFENWETNYAAKLGLGWAIDYASSWGLDRIRARVYRLADLLRARLTEVPGVTVHDQGTERCGLVTFTVDGRAAEHVQEHLAARQINVNVSRTASTRLDMERRGLSELVRASVHYYNVEDEIERFDRALRECAQT